MDIQVLNRTCQVLCHKGIDMQRLVNWAWARRPPDLHRVSKTANSCSQRQTLGNGNRVFVRTGATNHARLVVVVESELKVVRVEGAHGRCVVHSFNVFYHLILPFD